MLPISGPPKLLKKLKRFDKAATVSRLAFLLVIPSLHANTLRIELLIHLACLHCVGTRIPGNTEIDKWCNRYLVDALVVRYEDPIEQLMVSNIMTNMGNFRILNGIWEGNDFYLQQALDTLFDSDLFPYIRQLSQPILALLRLSESVIERLHLHRWQSGAGTPHGQLLIPSENVLVDNANILTVDRLYLEQNAIEIHDLIPFTADSSSLANLTNEFVGNSSLERRPLIRIGEDRLMFALPTAASVAIRMFLLDSLSIAGLLTAYQRKFVSKQTRHVFDELLRPLDGEPLVVEELPNRPARLPTATEGFGRFDTDKIAHVILLHDDLADICASGLCNYSTIGEEQREALINHVSTVATHLRNRLGVTSGITILIVGGIGRPRGLALGQIPEDWHCAMHSVSDFNLLAQAEDVTLLRLWKLEAQRDETRKNGLEIMNVAGERNLFSYWRKQSYCLISREMPYPGTDFMTLFSDFLLSMHQEVSIDYDCHVVRYNSSTFLQVRRLQPHPYFKEMRRQPVYGSIDRVRNGQLCGVVETAQRPWWLITNQKPVGNSARFLFGIWEALLGWLNKLAPILDAYMSEFGPAPLHIFVSVQELEAWPNLEEIENEAPMLPSTVLLEGGNGFLLDIPKSFRGFLRRSENIGEKLLVETVVSGIFALITQRTGHSPGMSTAELIGSLITNDDARSIHFFQALSPGQILSAVEALEDPRFVQPEDISTCRLGLAWRVNKNTPKATLSGKDTCSRYLERAVDQIWTVIFKHLKQVDRGSLIRLTLSNNEAILRDREHWSQTARALFAIHGDQEDVKAVAQKRETERVRASLASRVLVEMAICTASDGGPVASKSDYDTLIANVITLIELAYLRDAMRYDLYPHKLEIHPNGFIGVDNDLVEDTVRKYNTETSNEAFRKASENYEHHYRVKKERRPIEETYSPAFLSAFKAEYGLHLNRYIDVVAELWEIGMEMKDCIVSMEVPSFVERLIQKRSLSEIECIQFLNSFALQPRPKWDEVNRPFRSRDFYPWRYQRRLSLLMRPVVWSGNAHAGQIVVGLQALALSMSYLLGNIELGWMQQENVISEEMKN